MAVTINVQASQTALAQSIAAGVAAYNAKFAAQNQLNLQFNPQSFSQPLGRINGDLKQFQSALAASNARVLAFGASTAVIGGVAKSFKELATATIDVEKALVDINRVLALSSSGLQKFSNDLFGVAKATASSFKDASEAALEFSRQGLSTEQTLQRVSDALTLVRLTGVSAKQAVEDLTAVTNAYAQSSLDTTTILNKIVAVEQKFAVSAADLTSAVSRTGQAAQEAGVNFDQLNALVTATQEKTARGGAVIGNALKTIFTRLQRTETLDQLENFNVAVRDIEGNVLPAVQILQNLAKTYGTLADTTKSSLAEQVAGVYQVNILKSLISDLNDQQGAYNKALEIGANATNEAQQANAALNVTLAALISQTGTNLQQLSNNIGKVTFEPVFKSLISPFNDAVTYINDLLQGEGLGSGFANGLLKGIKNVLGGPVLIGTVAIITKVIGNTFKDISTAVPTLLGITTQAQKRKDVEESILKILQSQSTTSQALIGENGNLAAQQKILLDLATYQTAQYQQQLNIAKQLAPLLAGRNVQVGSAGLQVGRITASGYIPSYSAGYIPSNVRSAEIRGALAGGYQPGGVVASPVGGVMNTAESVKYVPNFVQPFINPPLNSPAGIAHRENSIRQTGINPYQAKGFIPNFAGGAGLFKSWIRTQPGGEAFLASANLSDINWYRENAEAVLQLRNYLDQYNKANPEAQYSVAKLKDFDVQSQNLGKRADLEAKLGKTFTTTRRGESISGVPETPQAAPSFNAATLVTRMQSRKSFAEAYPDLQKILNDPNASEKEKNAADQIINDNLGQAYEAFGLQHLKQIGYPKAVTAESLNLAGSPKTTAIDAVDFPSQTFFEFKGGEVDPENITSKFIRARTDEGNFEKLFQGKTGKPWIETADENDRALGKAWTRDASVFDSLFKKYTSQAWQNVLVANDYGKATKSGNKVVYFNPVDSATPGLYLMEYFKELKGMGDPYAYYKQSISAEDIPSLLAKESERVKSFFPFQTDADFKKFIADNRGQAPQKAATAGAIAQAVQNIAKQKPSNLRPPINWVYDSDIFGGSYGEKFDNLKNIILNDPSIVKDILVAPAGAGKTTYAAKLGYKPITNFEDIHEGDRVLLLSASRLAKEGGFSTYFQQQLDAVNKTGGKKFFGELPNELITQRRQLRAQSGVARGLNAPLRESDFEQMLMSQGFKSLSLASNGFIPNFASENAIRTMQEIIARAEGSNDPRLINEANVAKEKLKKLTGNEGGINFLNSISDIDVPELDLKSQLNNIRVAYTDTKGEMRRGTAPLSSLEQIIQVLRQKRHKEISILGAGLPGIKERLAALGIKDSEYQVSGGYEYFPLNQFGGFIPNFSKLSVGDRRFIGYSRVSDAIKMLRSGQYANKIQDNDLLNIPEIQTEKLNVDSKDFRAASARRSKILTDLSQANKDVGKAFEAGIAKKYKSLKLTSEGGSIKFGSSSALDLTDDKTLVESKAGNYNFKNVEEKFFRFPFENINDSKYSGFLSQFTTKKDNIQLYQDKVLKLITAPESIDKEYLYRTADDARYQENLKALLSNKGFIPNFAFSGGRTHGLMNRSQMVASNLPKNSQRVSAWVGPNGTFFHPDPELIPDHGDLTNYYALSGQEINRSIRAYINSSDRTISFDKTLDELYHDDYKIYDDGDRAYLIEKVKQGIAKVGLKFKEPRKASPEFAQAKASIDKIKNASWDDFTEESTWAQIESLPLARFEMIKAFLEQKMDKRLGNFEAFKLDAQSNKTYWQDVENVKAGLNEILKEKMDQAEKAMASKAAEQKKLMAQYGMSTVGRGFSKGFIPNFASGYLGDVMSLESNLSNNTAVLDTTTGPYPFIRNTSQPNFAAAISDHGGEKKALADSITNQTNAGLLSSRGMVPNFARPEITTSQLGIPAGNVLGQQGQTLLNKLNNVLSTLANDFTLSSKSIKKLENKALQMAQSFDKATGTTNAATAVQNAFKEALIKRTEAEKKNALSLQLQAAQQRGNQQPGVVSSALTGVNKFFSGSGAVALNLGVPIASGLIEQMIVGNKSREELTTGQRFAGSAVSNVASLATTGATLGSALGPAGTAIGALTGATVGLTKSFLDAKTTVDDLQKSIETSIKKDQEAQGSVQKFLEITQKIATGGLTPQEERKAYVEQRRLFQQIPASARGSLSVSSSVEEIKTELQRFGENVDLKDFARRVIPLGGSGVSREQSRSAIQNLGLLAAEDPVIKQIADQLSETSTSKNLLTAKGDQSLENLLKKSISFQALSSKEQKEFTGALRSGFNAKTFFGFSRIESVLNSAELRNQLSIPRNIEEANQATATPRLNFAKQLFDINQNLADQIAKIGEQIDAENFAYKLEDSYKTFQESVLKEVLNPLEIIKNQAARNQNILQTEFDNANKKANIALTKSFAESALGVEQIKNNPLFTQQLTNFSLAPDGANIEQLKSFIDQVTPFISQDNLLKLQGLLKDFQRENQQRADNLERDKRNNASKVTQLTIQEKILLFEKQLIADRADLETQRLINLNKEQSAARIQTAREEAFINYEPNLYGLGIQEKAQKRIQMMTNQSRRDLDLFSQTQIESARGNAGVIGSEINRLAIERQKINEVFGKGSAEANFLIKDLEKAPLAQAPIIQNEEDLNKLVNAQRDYVAFLKTTDPEYAKSKQALAALEKLQSDINIKSQEELDLLILKIKLEEKRIRDAKSFRVGVQSAFDQIREETDTFENRLGKTSVLAFRDGLTGAIDAAINRTDDLNSALMDVASGFLRTIQQAFNQQIANNLVMGFGSAFPSFTGVRQKGGIIRAQNGIYVPSMAGGNGMGIQDRGRTGDVNPALLEDGEYVLNRNAVAALGGPSVLDSLNFGQFPRFANGGQNTGSLSANAAFNEPFSQLSEFGKEQSPEYRNYLDRLRDQWEKDQAKKKQRRAFINQLIMTGVSAAVGAGLGALSRPTVNSQTTSSFDSMFSKGEVGFSYDNFVKPSPTSLSRLRYDNISATGINDLNSSAISINPYRQTGGLMRFASGGYLPYGNRLNDTIPALLSGGEYIVNSRSVRKYGVGGMNRINSGVARFEDGGLVGDPANKNNTPGNVESSNSNNVSINITVNNNGGSSSEQGSSNGGLDAQDKDNQLGQRIKQAVLQVITDEQRTGGLLDSTKKK